MILLISQAEGEISTELVYDWIQSFGGDVKRINGIDLLENPDFFLSSTEDSLNLGGFDMKDVDVIWYRRWIQGGTIDQMLLDQYESESQEYLKDQLSSYLKNEFKGLTSYFFFELNEKEWLNKPPSLLNYPSKSHQLKMAKEFGLKIPETIITSEKSQVKRFIEKHEKIITKNIEKVQLFTKNQVNIPTYTFLVEKRHLEDMRSHFFPTLFQEAVSKSLEIRVFYFKGDFFPMAIFSSQNEQTNVDFRRYDVQKPNRNVPFSLNNDLQSKLGNLLQFFNFDTASIDLILGDDGEYYFLEINPSGQFGMVSKPCNYNIEKKIAKYLVERDNEKR